MVAGDRYNDFVCYRRDVKVAVYHNDFNFAVIVGAYLKIFCRKTHFVVAYVCALCYCSFAFLVYDGNGAVRHIDSIALYRLLGSVVYLFGMVAGDRYGYSADRIDGQITIGSFRYDVLSSCIYGSYSVISEVCRIRSCLSTRSTDFNCGEVRTLGSAGEAGNGVLLAVISNGIAIGLEFNILIVVECDIICAGSDRYCLAVSGNRGVAVNGCRGFGYFCSKRLAINCFVWCDLIIRSVPVVVYRVGKVGFGRPCAGERDSLTRHFECAVFVN